MPSQVISYSADRVCSLLGIPDTCTEVVPDTLSLKPGEVLLWYPGFTLTQLRKTCLGKLRMEQDQDRYDQENSSAEPGYYAVQLRVPSSNRKNWREQQVLLAKLGESYQLAPVAVAATALLLHLQLTDSDLLLEDRCRCMNESSHKNCRFALAVRKGRVYVNDNWDDSRFYGLWLAGARKF